MSWKPMETAPKDGTVIVVYVKYPPDAPMMAVDVFHAFYQKSKGHWDALAEDVFFHTPTGRELATLLGWIEMPDSSPIAGTTAYRDGELAREPGRLHLAKVR